MRVCDQTIVTAIHSHAPSSFDRGSTLRALLTQHIRMLDKDEQQDVGVNGIVRDLSLKFIICELMRGFKISASALWFGHSFVPIFLLFIQTNGPLPR